ncbi:hypothetical protein MLD38_037109 [Melastoma candidum]|uniref:Uncharacterized protein n=1 Tax=Melastoma candidum TaxID=119954 RepID=A0ACB9LMA9_9MYRT|nr:hypothetical protein MLD38_037109 [Melastoma candidum]
MPSAAAKRRKAAAQKKKHKMAPRGVDSQVSEPAPGVTEGDDDLKTQEERDSDSSRETGSPASRDQHYPFGQGVGECEKGDTGGALDEPADGSVSEAIGDEFAVEQEINDEKDCEDSAEKGLDAADGFQNPVSEVIDELVQSDLQGIPVEEANGNTHEGDIDDGVKKVCPGLEDFDSPDPSAKTNGGFDELSFPSGSLNKNLVAGDGDVLDAHQSMLLTDGSVEIVNGAKREDDSEEKIIDGPGLGLPDESDNSAEEAKKDLIAELSLPNESTAQVDLLPEATSFKEELDDSGTVLKERKEGFDETGTPKDGWESFSEDNKGEQMLSSGCVIAKVENGAEKCNDATMANNDVVSVLEENNAAKLENGLDTSNLPSNSDVAALKENEHGDVLITGADIAPDGSCKEKTDDLEGAAHDNIDNQIELPTAARTVRKTSWMGCCGLFDVITGSVR